MKKFLQSLVAIVVLSIIAFVALVLAANPALLIGGLFVMTLIGLVA